jgi:hypothetical protein
MAGTNCGPIIPSIIMGNGIAAGCIIIPCGNGEEHTVAEADGAGHDAHGKACCCCCCPPPDGVGSGGGGMTSIAGIPV